MNRLLTRHMIMDEALDPGGEGGGAGGGQPSDGEASAAAAIAGAGGGQPSDGEASAAAAIAGAGGEKPSAGGEKPDGSKDGEKPDVPKGGEIDLAKMSDEDYAKLVQPDVEGEEVDRSLITPMAKELREAGIQPSVMAKVGAIYRKAVDAAIAKDEAARRARMKELADKCMAETSAEEKRDFAAAYALHIAPDPELKRIVDHTELGSNPAFIRLIALAGATLRVETPPPAAAAAGSGRYDTDRAVFEATVPKHLR